MIAAQATAEAIRRGDCEEDLIPSSVLADSYPDLSSTWACRLEAMAEMPGNCGNGFCQRTRCPQMVHDERETGWGGFAMILINIKQCFPSKRPMKLPFAIFRKRPRPD